MRRSSPVQIATSWDRTNREGRVRIRSPSEAIYSDHGALYYFRLLRAFIMSSARSKKHFVGGNSITRFGVLQYTEIASATASLIEFVVDCIDTFQLLKFRAFSLCPASLTCIITHCRNSKEDKAVHTREIHGESKSSTLQFLYTFKINGVRGSSEYDIILFASRPATLIP